MEDEELEKTILKISEALNFLDNINIFTTDKYYKSKYQKDLHKACDILFSLRRHLRFIKKRRGVKNDGQVKR